MITAIKIFCGIVIIVCIIHTVCCIYLIRGAEKNKPEWIKPWLIVGMISIVLTGLSVLGNQGQIVSFAFGIYLWICVWSLYKNLQEQSFQGVIYSAPPVQKV
jgi:hypothetical protein